MVPQTTTNTVVKHDIIHEGQIQQCGLELTQKRKTIECNSSLSPLFTIDTLSGLSKPVKQEDETQSDYISRLEDYHSSFTQSIFVQESSNNASRGASLLREDMTNEPIFNNCSGQRGSSNYDAYETNRLNPAKTRTSIRQRTYDSVPLTLLFIPILFLASNSDIRDKINTYSTGRNIPRMLHEKLVNSRRSRMAGKLVSPKCEPIYTSSEIQALNLQNTIFDFDFVTSNIGIETMFAFFSRLAAYPENYIEMVQFTTPVPLDSGFTTTECAIACTTQDITQEDITYLSTTTTTDQNNNTQTTTTPVTYSHTRICSLTASLHPYNSYGKSINGVHLTDSIIFARQLSLKGSSNILDITSNSIMFDISFISSNFALYLVKRMTVFANSSRYRKRVDSTGKNTNYTNSKSGTTADKNNDTTSSNGEQMLSSIVAKFKGMTTPQLKILSSVLCAILPILTQEKHHNKLHTHAIG